LIRSAISMANRIKTYQLPSVPVPVHSRSSAPSKNSNVRQSLETLTKSMKLIEEDILHEEKLSSMNQSSAREQAREGREGVVPERYLFLLRDLRYKVNELQEIFQKEFESEKEKWLKEKAVYSSRLTECNALLDEMNREKQQTIDSTKNYYERSLRQTEETLQNNMTIAKKEIERLEEHVRFLNQQLAQQQQQQQRQQPRQNNNNNSYQLHQGPQGQSAQQQQLALQQSLLMTKQDLEEFYRLQIQFQETINELEKAKIANQLLSKQFADEKNYMESNFSVLKKTYDKMIEGLEEKIVALQQTNENEKNRRPAQSMRRAGSSSEEQAERGNPILAEFNIDKLLELQRENNDLEAKYQLKCQEMESVIR
jgi:hypothetical protein